MPERSAYIRDSAGNAKLSAVEFLGTKPNEHGDVSWNIVLLVPRYRTVPSYFLKNLYGAEEKILEYFFRSACDSKNPRIDSDGSRPQIEQKGTLVD